MNLKFLIFPLVLGVTVATGACQPSAQDDTTVLIPNETSVEAPENQPLAEAPETQAVPGTEAQTEVRPEVLDKFARAMVKSQQIQEKAEAETWQTVEREGLSERQFVSMSLALQDPSTDTASEFTQEEKQKFNRAATQVGEIQQEAQKNMEQAIQNEGLDPQRFNQILAQVQEDPELLQEVQERMMQN